MDEGKVIMLSFSFTYRLTLISLAIKYFFINANTGLVHLNSHSPSSQFTYNSELSKYIRIFTYSLELRALGTPLFTLGSLLTDNDS